MPKATPKTIGPNLDFMADGTEILRGNMTWPRTHGQGLQGMFSDSALSQTCHCSLSILGGRRGGCLGVCLISSGSPAWSALEGTNTYLMAWGQGGKGGCFFFFCRGHPAGLEDKNGDNTALQYLSAIKKHKTLLSASMRALSTAAWGLPGGLRSGHGASRLPHSSSRPVSATAFLRPRSRCRASAKSSHIPCVSPGL